jgi:hypothetical protein
MEEQTKKKNTYLNEFDDSKLFVATTLHKETKSWDFKTWFGNFKPRSISKAVFLNTAPAG